MPPYDLTPAAEADLREIARCQHHYAFYVHPEGQKPLMLAVLHEYMGLLARLGQRRSG
jgi:plasmid stabilization system protein ParE